MQIVVIGAAGRTGAHIVEQAAQAQHQVTALVRDTTRYQPPTAGVDVHRADVLEPASLEGLLDGADAVIVAVGPHNGKKPAEVYSVRLCVAPGGSGVAEVSSRFGRSLGMSTRSFWGALAAD